MFDLSLYPENLPPRTALNQVFVGAGESTAIMPENGVAVFTFTVKKAGFVRIDFPAPNFPTNGTYQFLTKSGAGKDDVRMGSEFDLDEGTYDFVRFTESLTATGEFQIVISGNAEIVNPLTSEPDPTPTTNDDKAAVIAIAAKLKHGDSISDDDLIFYRLKDSVLAKKVMVTLDGGGGYDELRALGVTDSPAIDILGIYNVKIEAWKYESECGIDGMANDPTKIGAFINYLVSTKTQLPDLNPLFAAIRHNRVTYAALRDWNKKA